MKKAILIIIILAALGFGIGFYMSSKENNTTSNSLANNSTNSTSVDTTNNNTNNTTSSTTQNNSSNNENNTVNTSNSSQKTSTTSSQSSNNNNSSSSESYTLNSPLFSDEYQNIYDTLMTKAKIGGIPGSYAIGNFDLSITVDGTKYYYLYTGLQEAWAMGGFPGQEDTFGYISESGKTLDSNDLTEIINQFNNESNQEKYNQIYKIATQYIADDGWGRDLNNYIHKLNIDLNKTIQKDGQTLYSVTYTPDQPNGFKDPTAQMYVGGTGLVYLPDFYKNYAKIFGSKYLYEDWENAPKTGY